MLVSPVMSRDPGRCRSLPQMLTFAALLAMAWPAASALAAEESADGYDCQRLEAQAAPATASDWFGRSLWANHCYEFKARAVRIGSDGVRTLALTHNIRDGIEHEVARFLDGDPVVFERRGRIGRGGWASGDANAPTSPQAIMAKLDEHYRLSLGGEERIAGRAAVRLDIEPLDDMRFGQRLWLDKVTALPLKQMLLDTQGRVLETFQITDIEHPTVFEGQIEMDRVRPSPNDAWQPGWLPPGFVPQPVATADASHADKVPHRLFSDGLSSLSMFVEPLDPERPALAPGLHRLGISYAAVRHMVLGGQPMQVVAMGELPPKVLIRVVERVGLAGAESSSQVLSDEVSSDALSPQEAP
ncbi:sigma E regulatory protein, MucB/RseB [Onishia taeanensis]|uniref:Sigma E regulatory protein, MucB/RseB n=2 Tax=Onishia taeanensis TaxID=284577 RepID=A0A1G7R3U9_9GAMM|nr:sigma E regulatory protein, MucB/RseB [Halomonas taeanensis]